MPHTYVYSNYLGIRPCLSAPAGASLLNIQRPQPTTATHDREREGGEESYLSKCVRFFHVPVCVKVCRRWDADPFPPHSTLILLSLSVFKTVSLLFNKELKFKNLLDYKVLCINILNHSNYRFVIVVLSLPVSSFSRSQCCACNSSVQVLSVCILFTHTSRHLPLLVG